MEQNNIIDQKKDFNQNNDDIDISQLFDLVKRKKRLISIVSSASVISSVIFGFLQPKEYQGGFQIVVRDNQSGGIDQKGNFQDFAFLGLQLGGDNKLATEVEILKSPSILMPVFDLVKSQKKIKNKKAANLKFSSWLKRHLDVEIEPQTSVLNISYKDYDKELISKVLNKISFIYQNYSSDERLTGVNEGINYLDKQIEVYRNKSLNSIIAAQEFEIKNDLTIAKENMKSVNLSTGLVKTIPQGIGGSINQPSFINTISIDKIRSSASNEIRTVNEYLNELNRAKNDPNKFFYLVKAYKNADIQKLIKRIEEVDFKITEKLAFFTNEDIAVVTLQKEKRRLLKLLINQTLSFLEAQKTLLESTKKSAERPIETLTEYKALLLEASRDEQILNNLESQKQSLSLELARQSNPWKLITKPTVLEQPIGPIKKRIAFLGLISGFILSTLSAFLIEKKEDKIYHTKKVINILKKKPLAKLKLSNKEDLALTISVFGKSKFMEKAGSELSFFYISNLDNLELENLKDNFNEIIKNKNFTISKNMDLSNNLSYQILILRIGKTTFSELINYQNKIEILNKELANWILLED